MLGLNKKYVDVFHKNKQYAPSHSLAGLQTLRLTLSPDVSTKTAKLVK